MKGNIDLKKDTSPATTAATKRARHVFTSHQRQDITASYHGVTHDEDGKVRVTGFHQVDVLQGVSDVNLEILDVHPLSFALAVANCRSETKRCWGVIIFAISKVL